MSIDGRLFLLCIIAASVVGAATGIIITSASPRETGLLPAPASPLMAKHISLIASSVKALEKNFRQLTTRLDRDRGPSKATAVQREIVKQKSLPVAAHPRQDAQIQKHAAHWVDVLDKDISRVLVERGLTPFDSGMGDYLKEACDGLRRVRGEHSSKRSAYRDKLNKGQIRDGDYNRLTAVIRKEWSRKHSIIVKQFRAAMDSLR